MKCTCGKSINFFGPVREIDHPASIFYQPEVGGQVIMCEDGCFNIISRTIRTANGHYKSYITSAYSGITASSIKAGVITLPYASENAITTTSTAGQILYHDGTNWIWK